jgi:hypothetical protein
MRPRGSASHADYQAVLLERLPPAGVQEEAGGVTGVDFDPLRESRFPEARAAREQANWLSWLEIGGIRPRTLDDYSWSTDRLLEAFPSKAFQDFTDGDLLHVLKRFPPRSRRVRLAAYKSWFLWGVKTRRIPGNPVDLLPRIQQVPPPSSRCSHRRR